MGKGDGRRPAAVDRRTWEARWASINWNVDGEDEPDPPSADTALSGLSGRRDRPDGDRPRAVARRRAVRDVRRDGRGH